MMDKLVLAWFVGSPDLCTWGYDLDPKFVVLPASRILELQFPNVALALPIIWYLGSHDLWHWGNIYLYITIIGRASLLGYLLFSSADTFCRQCNNGATKLWFDWLNGREDGEHLELVLGRYLKLHSCLERYHLIECSVIAVKWILDENQTLLSHNIRLI